MHLVGWFIWICFGQFLCPSLGVFHCTHSNGIYRIALLTACEQDQNGTAVPFWSCSQAVSKPVWQISLLCVQWKTPDDGQRNCPKHVDFHSKNKFEKLVHLVGFIIRNLTRCAVTWTSNSSLYGLQWRVHVIMFLVFYENASYLRVSSLCIFFAWVDLSWWMWHVGIASCGARIELLVIY